MGAISWSLAQHNKRGNLRLSVSFLVVSVPRQLLKFSVLLGAHLLHEYGHAHPQPPHNKQTGFAGHVGCANR